MFNATTNDFSYGGAAAASVNPIFAAEQQYNMESTTRSVGENGAAQLTEYGLCTKSHTPDYVGSLVALSTELSRGNTSKKPVAKGHARDIGFDRCRVRHLVDNVLCGPYPRYGKIWSNITKDMIVMFFNLRDIRGEFGKQERTLAYWLFMELCRNNPMELIANLLPIIPHYGSWNDLNAIYEICYTDVKLLDAGSTTPYLLPRDIYSRLCDLIADTYAVQLMEDIDSLADDRSGVSRSNKISLAARWVPKEGRALDKLMPRNKSIVKNICKRIYPESFKEDFKVAMRLYRKDISAINRTINTTEQNMAHGEFHKIKFELVPGRCLNKHRRAWLGEDKSGEIVNRDHDRQTCRHNYMQFLSKASRGEVSAKGTQMFVHELTEKMKDCSDSDEQLFNAQFQNHVDAISATAAENGTNLGNSVVIADVSGSMTGDPMNVAIGLALVMSSPGIASPGWENIAMTFSTNPTWIKLTYPESLHEWNSTTGYSYSLESSSIYSPLGTFDTAQAGRDLTWTEKVRVMYRADWGGSTDFAKALNLIAIRASQCGVKMPNVYTISDMQWNVAYSNPSISSSDGPFGNLFGGITHSNPDTFIHMAKNAITDWDINLGKSWKMVFWNVRGGGHPCGADETGLVEVSGFSTNTLRLFLQTGDLKPSNTGNSDTSWDTLRMALDSPDYHLVTDILGLTTPSLYGGMIQPDSITTLPAKYEDTISTHPIGMTGVSHACTSPFKPPRRTSSVPPPAPPAAAPAAESIDERVSAMEQSLATITDMLTTLTKQQ